MTSYKEELISKIPAVQLLIAMGDQYLTPDQALSLRGGSERSVILTEVLVEWLRTHNSFTFKGGEHSFTDSAIHEAVRRLTDITLQDGLTRTNEQVYETLTLGIALPQSVHGDTRSFSKAASRTKLAWCA